MRVTLAFIKAGQSQDQMAQRSLPKQPIKQLAIDKVKNQKKPIKNVK